MGKAAEGAQGAFEVRYAFLPAPGAAGLEWHQAWPDPKKLPRLMEARVSLGTAAAFSVSQWLAVPQGSLQTLTDAQPSPAPSPGVPPAGPTVP